MEEMLKAYPATANPLLCGGSLLYAGAEKMTAMTPNKTLQPKAAEPNPTTNPASRKLFPFRLYARARFRAVYPFS